MAKRRKGRSGQKGRFTAAAKSCKGKKRPAFQACMAKKLKRK